MPILKDMAEPWLAVAESQNPAKGALAAGEQLPPGLREGSLVWQMAAVAHISSAVGVLAGAATTPAQP